MTTAPVVHSLREQIREHIVYKRSYAHRDFKNDYHAFRGNAYGLVVEALTRDALKAKSRTLRAR